MLLKNLILSFISFGILSNACAQNNSQVERYANEIKESSAREHLTTLASDDFEGRDTGKPGGQKAAQYIADEFKKLNLSAPVNNSYFQPIELTESQFQVQSFNVNNESYRAGQDFFMTGSGKETTISVNDILFIGYGISSSQYDDLKGIDITNKVVLVINEGEPVNTRGISYITGKKQLSDWSTQPNKRLQAILAKNPKLILAVSSNVQSTLDDMGESINRSRIVLKEDFKEPVNTIGVAHITVDIANQLLKQAGISLTDLKKNINNEGVPSSKVIPTNLYTSFGTHINDVKSQNVLGYLEGSDLKDELIVISAHYDHVGVSNGEIYNGADDDASGTTGVLEMARAFTKSKEDGHGPRRSILFMTVTGEEKGLLGSDYYTRHPIYPLENTVSNLNIDMIGRIDPAHQSNPNYIYLIGSDKLSSELHKISEQVNAEHTQLSLDYKYNDPNDPERIYYRSDHYNFAKNRIPVIFYFNGVHEDYHQPTDTADKINFELLIKRTKLVFYTAWEIANRDKRLVIDSNKR
ncbi:M28 family metallopeptidase [Albibacterium sp.]|uniref:M28 family metallopeptidase n=1 Tax=Albibacterium sp. TaxID=2952885 RepID=UPI002C03EC8C|nr:M28 family metallopeptidase [Albibacterium sp.]HUH18059.1 M28 family metallopeptidase [Albibacterium sp.]